MKDFAVGFGIGICHGAANNIVARHIDSNLTNQNASKDDKHIFNFISFGAAHALNKEYLTHKYVINAKSVVQNGPNLPAAFGHGLGQLVAESFDP